MDIIIKSIPKLIEIEITGSLRTWILKESYIFIFFPIIHLCNTLATTKECPKITQNILSTITLQCVMTLSLALAGMTHSNVKCLISKQLFNKLF